MPLDRMAPHLSVAAVKSVLHDQINDLIENRIERRARDAHQRADAI